MHKIHALSFALLAIAPFAQAAEQTRTLAPFSTITSKGNFVVTVQVGKAQALTVSGSDAVIKQVSTEVKGKELIIKADKVGSDISKVTITMPALTAFDAQDTVDATITDMSGENLSISYQGAGKLVASGKVNQLTMLLRGAGNFDTKALLAQNVDVTFDGMGSVKLYAQEKLNAVSRGFGELEYYGKPRSVTKTTKGRSVIKAAE